MLYKSFCPYCGVMNYDYDNVSQSRNCTEIEVVCFLELGGCGRSYFYYPKDNYTRMSNSFAKICQSGYNREGQK